MVTDGLGVPIPAAIRERVTELIGPVQRVEPLGGMSGAGVVRVVGRSGTRVVKRTGSDREAFVYRDLAPVLAEAGVRIPGCDGAVTIDGAGAWLVLEDVPEALPRERWGVDPAVFATLARLHALPVSVLEPIGGGFRPVWDDALDRAAGRWLPPDVMAMLGVARETFQALGDTRWVISGDPNPLNWGIASDGTVVLLDWERIGTGHPAIDVAIALPGLPGQRERLGAIERYTVARRDGGPAAETIHDQQIVAAKVWTALGIFAEAQPGEDPDDETSPAGRLAGVARTLTGSLPGWLEASMGRDS
ncbi:MAG TPA: phosphotransferase [Thermomicrobiales bacterium]|jgi:hypothetical protein|nr:phosphotransferase [Thermomicrobiales bacterium]